jgi:hypothetical protein
VVVVSEGMKNGSPGCGREKKERERERRRREINPVYDRKVVWTFDILVW